MTDHDDHPDGQLCPNPDCCHDLAFDKAGFWRCPACKQVFYAEESDSDYEDYSVYRAEDGLGKLWMGGRPAVIPVARDLGPSLGTPR